MAPSNPSKNPVESAAHQNQTLEELADHPLNYNRDRVSEIVPQLRQLNLELGLETARGIITDPSSALLLSGAVGCLLKRKFAAASFLVVGFLLQQALAPRRRMSPKLRRKGGRERSEIEMERYALKAQRGDYGELEVIPFK